MKITINPFGAWRRVATIEVGPRVKDLQTLVQNDSLRFQLVEANSPRRTFKRFDLVVDSTEGERRCARTAWAVLSAMREAATHGCIDHFRVIEGDRWLSEFETPTSATASDSHMAVAA